MFCMGFYFFKGDMLLSYVYLIYDMEQEILWVDLSATKRVPDSIHRMMGVIVLLHKSGTRETKAESDVGVGAAKLECEG